MKISSLYSFLIVFFIFSCDQSSVNDEISHNTIPPKKIPDTTSQVIEEPPLPSENKTPTRKGYQLESVSILKKFDNIALGTNYQTLKTEFPSLKEPKFEKENPDPSKKELIETTGEVSISGMPANIKFLLRNDSLYAYSINLSEEDFEKAEEFNDALLKYYSKKYGDYKTERVEEENRFFRTVYWFPKDKVLVMNYNINTGSFLWFYKKNDKK